MENINLKSHIKSYWKFYVLGIIISFIISSILMIFASNPSKKEKITLFITCDKISENANTYFESIKPEYLELLDVNFRNVNDDYYSTVIESYCDLADILIIPESKLGYIVRSKCVELNDDIIDSFTDKEFDYYNKDGFNLGIKIYSKDTKEGILEGLISFNNDENYYLFINRYSYHLGDINSSNYTGAIDVLREIINYED